MPSNRFLFHTRKWLFQLLKWLARLFFSFLLLFAITLFALQFDAVQNAVLPPITRFVSQKLGTKIEIGSVSIALMDKIVLNQVTIYDKNQAPMILADEVYVGVISLDFYEMIFPQTYQNVIGARMIELHNAELRLYDKNGTVNIEEVFASDDQDTTPSRSDLYIDFPNIYFYNFRFSYIDSSATPAERAYLPQHWNYQNLHLQNTQLIGGFYYHKRDQMRIDIRHLTTQEPNTQLVIDTLSGHIKVKLPNPNYPDTVPYFQFSDMLVKLHHSRLDFDALIWNDKFPTLFKSTSPKDYRLHFRPSYVTFQDISFFIPEDTIPLKGRVDLQGKVNMNLTTLKGNDLLLTYNQRTQLHTDLRIDHYTDSEALFLQTKIKNSTLYTEDIDSLLSTLTLPPQIANMGVVKVEGKFVGFLKDFVSDATFEGPVGKIITNLNMKIRENEILYKGDLQTQNLNIDQIFGLKDTIAPALNFSGKIDGKNFDLATMSTKAEFTVTQSPLLQNLIDSLKANLTFEQKTLKGFVNVLDNELQASVGVQWEFRSSPIYNFYGNLQKIDLQKFHITPKPWILSSLIDLKLQGDSLENLKGFIRAYKTELENTANHTHFRTEDAELIIQNEAHLKDIELTSPLLNLHLNTNFLYSEIPSALQELWNEAQLYFRNQSDSLTQYYQNKKILFHQKTFNAQATILEVKPLMQFMEQPIQISPNTSLQLSANYSQNLNLSFHVHSDSFAYDENHFYRMDTRAQIVKNLYANDWDLQATAQIDSLRLGGLALSKFLLRPKLQQNALQIEWMVEQKQQDLLNRLHWFATGTIDTLSSIALDPNRSITQLGNTQWTFNPENKISFKEGFLALQNLQLHHQEEFLNLSGEVSENKNRITLRIHNLALQTIHKIYRLHPELKGNLDAKIVIQKPFEAPLATINGQIEELTFSNVHYGKISILSEWDETTNLIGLSLGLIQTQDTILGLKGIYNPIDQVSPLTFSLSTSNLNLKLIQPFLQEYVYDLKGSISLHNLSITGSLTQPKIAGSAQFYNTSLGVQYLKTKFFITNQKGSIQFNQTQLHLRNLEIKDIRGKTALLNGTLNYAQLSNLQYNFSFTELRNFLILNTQKQDNELFYGKAIVKKGSLQISGNPDITSFNADLTTDAGTKLHIPITSYVKGSRLDYVYFTQKNATQNKHKVKISGIQLEMNIEATPEAELLIIFDEKAGDIIRGNGYGNLALYISPDGEFSMMGKYTIQKGDYLFTAQNIINKKFFLEEGGSITWTGDPYEASVDIRASYKVNASLSSLDTTLKNFAKVQVQILMTLRGSLLNPEISLSLLMPALTQNEAVTIVQQFKNIENDPQELNRQVFSLLMFGRFAPPNTFFGENAGSSGVTSSLSELLSNQLNSWLGQSLKEDLGVSLSSNRFDDLTVLVQAKLFNDRITISRDGAITNTNQRDLTVGNISIHIKLLPSDKKQLSKENPAQLAIEIFNRENLGISNNLLATYRGAGLFFKKDFDNLLELLQPAKNKKRKAQ